MVVSYTIVNERSEFTPRRMHAAKRQLLCASVRITAYTAAKNFESAVKFVREYKTMAEMMGQFPSLPYKQAAGLFANYSNGPVFTYNASYVCRLQENDPVGLLEGYYMLYPAEASQTVLEMAALPESFCICINQGGDTTEYADAFCEVLRENGISCRVEDVLRGNPGYIELREYEKW